MCESYQFGCKKDMQERSSFIETANRLQRSTMKHRILLNLAFVMASGLAVRCAPAYPALHVLPPITRGALSIFPVVGGAEYDTTRILTLDEGIRAGSVVVTEQGSARGLVRGARQSRPSEAEVNRLVLINNSNQPLLLLAGEIVTGGKQDRVIGADRLVPAKSDPIDLSVFCVEHGRWVEQSEHFGSMKLQMAQPSVREPAMAAHNQQQVWNSVAAVRSSTALMLGGLADRLPQTSSYASTMAFPQVQAKIDDVAGGYDDVLRELRKSGAKGVVVAIHGNLVWADIFASDDLLARYWKKLIRSYAAESLTMPEASGKADRQAAQQFLEQVSGNHQVIETEPGVFRRAETSGAGYEVFTLTGLIAKLDFDVHTAKMSCAKQTQPQLWPIDMRLSRPPGEGRDW
jgi:hypothetical protein